MVFKALFSQSLGFLARVLYLFNDILYQSFFSLLHFHKPRELTKLVQWKNRVWFLKNTGIETWHLGFLFSPFWNLHRTKGIRWTTWKLISRVQRNWMKERHHETCFTFSLILASHSLEMKIDLFALGSWVRNGIEV